MMGFNPGAFREYMTSAIAADARRGEDYSFFLRAYQVFVVGRDLAVAANSLRIEEAANFEEYEDAEGNFVFDFNHVAPETARCPAESTVLAIENENDGWAVFSVISGISIGKDSVLVCQILPDRILPLGSYTPGKSSPKVDVHCNRSRAARLEAMAYIVELSFLVALINQPRFVKRACAVSRQQRRALGRSLGMGFAVDAWTRVSWNIGKDVVAKLSREPDFHPMPLHFRRGHWRSCKESVSAAKWLTATEAGRRGAGWYLWVKECWPGHPAFGIKKSYHAPKLLAGAA